MLAMSHAGEAVFAGQQQLVRFLAKLWNDSSKRKLQGQLGGKTWGWEPAKVAEPPMLLEGPWAMLSS